MVRKLAELPKFLMFNYGTKSFRSSFVLLFTYYCSLLYRYLYLHTELLAWG
jgi:hypothetical protein